MGCEAGAAPSVQGLSAQALPGEAAWVALVALPPAYVAPCAQPPRRRDDADISVS